MRRAKGFTLIELMVVLAVAAIVSSIGYSLYNSQVLKSKRNDGISYLVGLMNKQEQYYAERKRYTLSFLDLGYVRNNNIYSDNEHYKISLKLCAGETTTDTCVLVEAAPNGEMVGDAVLQLDSKGNRYPKDKW